MLLQAKKREREGAINDLDFFSTPFALSPFHLRFFWIARAIEPVELKTAAVEASEKKLRKGRIKEGGAKTKKERRQRPGALAFASAAAAAETMFFSTSTSPSPLSLSLHLPTHRVDAAEKVLVEAHLVERLGGLLPLGVELAAALGVLLIDFFG